MSKSIRIGVDLNNTIYPTLGFTRRCLRSLESLGDNAATSKNHTEAIAHYSMVLSMGPVPREGILTKRSKAYAAAHMWDDALKDADEVCPLLSPFHQLVFNDVVCRGDQLESYFPFGL